MSPLAWDAKWHSGGLGAPGRRLEMGLVARLFSHCVRVSVCVSVYECVRARVPLPGLSLARDPRVALKDEVKSLCWS